MQRAGAHPDGRTRLADAEAGTLIDLMLSYRATKAWEADVRVAAAMPPPLAETAMVREQRAMALNRASHGDEAAEILDRLIAERGPSSETYGILGRVLKDRWEAAGDGPLARGLLRKATDAYRRGCEADWRDAHPGVNAVTLMELADPPLKEEQARLLPVVRYTVERRIAAGKLTDGEVGGGRRSAGTAATGRASGRDLHGHEEAHLLLDRVGLGRAGGKLEGLYDRGRGVEEALQARLSESGFLKGRPA